MVHGRRCDEKHWRAHIFGILSPAAGEPIVRDKVTLKTYQTTKTYPEFNIRSGADRRNFHHFKCGHIC